MGRRIGSSSEQNQRAVDRVGVPLAHLAGPESPTKDVRPRHDEDGEGTGGTTGRDPRADAA
ncbi:hypothetical protein [Segeticoccus rhizosphaerae]|uniref:hypothetical protein n=1 Tax=Segeticoccus rhizosphaerae TaxID=1104777 RepID=UPI001264B8A9|nr:hypothetical protein [Segeticoccus rhizosphaerae]